VLDRLRLLVAEKKQFVDENKRKAETVEIEVGRWRHEREREREREIVWFNACLVEKGTSQPII
jgi:hypothetical protein